jgi:serine/threonine-protein kinase RsbW
VGQLRHRVEEFATAAGASEDLVRRIALAVSEAVTNVVLHAYEGDGGQVRVSCRGQRKRFTVEVIDEGAGIGTRHDSPGIGHGLTIVGALAQTLEIASGPAGLGTIVTMGFGPTSPADAPPGLEALCALALETVADASCLDLIHDGVLRRVAAQVAEEPTLTAWFREALPPAKPGTATWAALRGGGPSLVIHDPAVPRSPGGPGERLNLTWWVAVAIETPAGAPEALWGFGGREQGRSVPSENVIRVLANAARSGLAQPAERAILRAQLASAHQ